jgi:hypothetical protein
MKTTRVIGLAMLMAVTAIATYWFCYQRGATAKPARINSANSLRQTGLSVRQDRNDLFEPFITHSH